MSERVVTFSRIHDLGKRLVTRELKSCERHCHGESCGIRNIEGG